MNNVYVDHAHLPLPFWVCVLLLVLLTANTLYQRRSAWAIPCLAVLGTAFAWYLGDILYSGIDPIADLFPRHIINRALWQVMLFLVAYSLLCKEVAHWFVKGREDHAALLDQRDLYGSDAAQNQLKTVLWFSISGWAIVMLIGLIRSKFPLLPTFAPYLAGRYVDLWARERLGGATGFLVSTGYFVHTFFCAIFGGVLVLSRRTSLRVMATIMIVLSWPYWLFGYGRNVVLVIGIPATCGYFFFSRQRLAMRIAVVVMAFMAVNMWFKFTLATRHTEGIAEAFTSIMSGEESMDFVKETKHLGLDMFKELCYMNHYIEKETHHVNWGKGYFAELVNFIPRAWWPGKPTVGVEFSIVRGSQTRGMGDELVTSIITPGMVGQGVENFGGILGPIAAAFLMSLWTGILAMLWTQRQSVIRACLFLVGLGLTFNAGRVITLQVFFPFIFGYLLIRIYEHNERYRSIARGT